MVAEEKKQLNKHYRESYLSTLTFEKTFYEEEVQLERK